MTYKWNTSEAEVYAKNFSSLICNEYFKEANLIHGNDILKLTEIRQLNLFIVANLYEKWQDETKRLKSPFFNFEHEEVKKALAEFMNVLSRHIAVEKESFEPTLAAAVKQTLHLNASPLSYFEEQMRNLPDFKLTTAWLHSNGKYYMHHSWLLKELLDRLNGLPFVYANQAIDWVREIFNANPNKIEGKDLEAFDKIMPLISASSATIPASKIINEENKISFFDAAFQQYDEPQPTTIPVINQEAPPALLVEPTPVAQPIEEKILVKTPQPSPELNTFSGNISLNDKHHGATSTLNDRIVNENGTLQEKHAKSKIESIRSAISLNQRFLFINNLFGGDVQTFSQALNELEECPSFAAAKEQMVKVYLPKYKWNISSAEAEEFFDILKRRYN